jgi:hypothetical protein
MKATEPADILKELSAREPIFHRREFGTSRQDLDRMIDANFFEIGASGKVYQQSLLSKICLNVIEAARNRMIGHAETSP